MWMDGFANDGGFAQGGGDGLRLPDAGGYAGYRGGMGNGDPRRQGGDDAWMWQQPADGTGQLHYAPEFSLDQLVENWQSPDQGEGQQQGGRSRGGKGGRKNQGNLGDGNNWQELQMAMGVGMGGPGSELMMPGNILQGGKGRMPPGTEPPPHSWAGTTTVMMRNLPNKYTQRMLLTEVAQVGFLGTFDFLYLPIDPETSANRGYAFLNFIDSSFAWMFKVQYEGRKMAHFNSNKVVSVTPATLQGFDSNYTHYSSARVNRGDPAARPLFLREPSQQAQQASKQGAQRSNKKQQGGGPRRKAGENDNADTSEAQPAAGPDGEEAGSGGPRPQAPAPPAPAGDGEDAPKPTLKAKFCPHCGGAIKEHFQFCAQCGASLPFTS